MFICSQSPKKGTQQCNLGAFQLPLNKIAGLPRNRLDVAAGVLYRLMCSASQLACESPSRQFKAISGISTVFCDLWCKLALSKKFMTWCAGLAMGKDMGLTHGKGQKKKNPGRIVFQFCTFVVLFLSSPSFTGGCSLCFSCVIAHFLMKTLILSRYLL